MTSKQLDHKKATGLLGFELPPAEELKENLNKAYGNPELRTRERWIIDRIVDFGEKESRPTETFALVGHMDRVMTKSVEAFPPKSGAQGAAQLEQKLHNQIPTYIGELGLPEDVVKAAKDCAELYFGVVPVPEQPQ